MITPSQFVQGMYQAKRFEILDCGLRIVEVEYFWLQPKPILDLQSQIFSRREIFS
jgi:hypothetical protein